jgi:hypothetical protein
MQRSLLFYAATDYKKRDLRIVEILQKKLCCYHRIDVVKLRHNVSSNLHL